MIADEHAARNAQIRAAVTAGASYRELAEQHGISRRQVGNIVTGKADVLAAQREAIKAAKEAAALGATPTRPKVFIADIVTAAARVFGLSRSDITGQRRLRAIMPARIATYYLARELTDTALNGIGRAIGGRDHSTVLHGCRMAEAMMAADSYYCAKVERVRCIVTGGEPFALMPAHAPQPKPAPVALPVSTERLYVPEWWELSDDDLIEQRIAAHRDAGRDFIEART